MTKEVTSANNYLELLTEFISFLASDERTLDEILSYMVQVVLSPLNAEAILIRQLNSENQVLLIATWGISSESLQGYPVAYNLNERWPSTDTLRYRTTTVINTLPDWGDDYPLLKELKYNSGAKSYICFPIDKAGTPVAAIGVFSRDVFHPNAEIEAFLKAVGSVFSMYMFRQGSSTDETLKNQRNYTLSGVGRAEKELTERQYMILRLMSENQTNLVIGELLGYSESTIRQETIKIFAKLGCSGRHEAALIYKEQFV